MTKNDIKELPNSLDNYGRKIIITDYSKELTNFLDEYGVNYKIVENRVEAQQPLQPDTSGKKEE